MKFREKHIGGNVKKYFFVAIGVLLLGLIYQNCDSGGDSLIKSKNSASGGGTLDFYFTYSTQYVPLNQSNVIIQGKCTVESYTDHRIDWSYTFGTTKYTGRTDRPCVDSTGTFMLVIPVSQLTGKVDNSSFDFSGTITGLKKGVTTPGPTNKVKITFSASQTSGTGTTGGTTGSTAGSTGGTSAGSTGHSTSGNTTGVDYCAGATGTRQLFCAQCPDEGRKGLTEYCSADYPYAAYCASVTLPEDRRDIVDQVAAERPDLLAKCGRNASENGEWNAFTTEVIRRLRSEGLWDSSHWGFNGVRGNTNDINGDTISYWGADGAPQEGEVGGVVFDVVISCGESNTPAWQIMNPYCGCCTKMSAWTLGGKF